MMCSNQKEENNMHLMMRYILYEGIDFFGEQTTYETVIQTDLNFSFKLFSQTKRKLL